MALQGDLGDFPLTDIIQLLDLSKKTGAIFMQGQRGQQQIDGWLYFRDGKIIGAQLGKLAPLEAVYTFFTFVSGPFRFHDDVQLDVPTITQSNEMLIMEGIMRQDAWAKIQDHVPSLNMVPQLVTNPSATGFPLKLTLPRTLPLGCPDEQPTISDAKPKTARHFVVKLQG